MVSRRTHAELLALWFERIDPQPNGCWYWTGALNQGNYGTFGLRGNNLSVMAHRFGYISIVGPIPDGLHLDHVCHNADPDCPGGVACLHRRCVNPAHLEPVTSGDNTRRSPIRQRQSEARRQRLAARPGHRTYTEEERKPKPGIPHGHPGSYTNHRCRCDDCRAAWSAYLKQRRLINPRPSRAKRRAA